MGLGRRIRDLGGVEDLPDPCRACRFWESGTAAQGPGGDARAAHEAKEAWWRATELEWGSPGFGAWVDDACVGYATLAPARHFPRARALRRPVSEDALLLATLWVQPDHRGGGLGKSLVHAVLREAARRGVRAVEAFGVRVDDPPAWGCFVPASFLESQGFTVHREDPLHPLLRLDLRQTVRWQESLGHALGSVVGVLKPRPERLPRPAPDSGA